MVPVLVLVINMPIKMAVGTSLFVIIFSSVVGAVSHFFLGNVDFSLVVWIVLGGLVGVNIGIRVLRHICSKKLEFLFSVLLILAAGYLFAEALAS